MPTFNNTFNGGIPPDDPPGNGSSAAQKLFEDLDRVMRPDDAVDDQRDACALSARARLIAANDHRLSTGGSIADSLLNSPLLVFLLIALLASWWAFDNGRWKYNADGDGGPEKQYLLTLQTEASADLPHDPGRAATAPLIEPGERTRALAATKNYSINNSSKNNYRINNKIYSSTYNKINRPARPAAERPDVPPIVHLPNQDLIECGPMTVENYVEWPGDSLNNPKNPGIPDKDPAILLNSTLFEIEGDVFVVIKNGKVHCGKTKRFNRYILDDIDDEPQLFYFNSIKK